MPTKHRKLPDHGMATALQNHARAQCAHEDHDLVRVTTCPCGHEEREVIPRDAPDADEAVYTPEVIGDLVRLALKGFLDVWIEDGELRIRMQGETLGERLENGLNRVEARHAGGAWRDDGDTLRIAAKRQ